MTTATHIVSTSLPARLVALIDRKTETALDTRAAWLRRAIYRQAAAEGLLKIQQPPHEDALELDRILG